MHRCMLFRSVAVQQGTVDFYKRPPLIGHPQHRKAGYPGDNGSLQILFMCILQKSGNIGRTDNHGHSLLALADRPLGTIETFVLGGYGIEVDHKTGGKLADGYTDPAGSKVIASLDQR